MTQDVWSAVDRYVIDHLVPEDAVLAEVVATSDAAGLPSIHVSPPLGKLLHLLARIHGARRILEIGTLAGYSTIWLSRALPTDGHLVTLELDAMHAEVARSNLARAGLADHVDVRIGAAIDVLPRLRNEGQGPFDLVFVDADKASYPAYFEWALRLSRPGTVLVFDNVVRNGAVIDEGNTDPNVQGVRLLHELVEASPHVDATSIQTVGSKGYDGFLIAIVCEPAH